MQNGCLTSWGCYLLLLLISACVGSNSSGKPPHATEVPHPVKQAFTHAYPDAVIQQYCETIKNSDKRFEIVFREKDTRYTVTYDENGRRLMCEAALPVDRLPAAISEKIGNEIPRFKIVRFKRVEKPGENFFKVEIINIDNDKNIQFIFSDNGQLIERERS